MKSDMITSKEEREKIFSLFLQNHRMRFSEIENAVGVRSNQLDYHLKKLIEENIIEKEGEFYVLTKSAESLIPFYQHMTGKESGALPIVAVAILNGEKICLLKRKRRPYQGYWGLIGGKVKLEESLKETALREVEEETGLKCKFDRVVSVLHERVKDSGKIKHAFVIFLCRVNTKNETLVQSEEGDIAWFSLNELPKEIIPSDKLMISKLLDKGFRGNEIVIEDKDGKLVKMEVEEFGG
ncbi:MAG: NUDIX domain-containing protein [archaeon]|nr:NUDIX domain-containing protein [archaeon]